MKPAILLTMTISLISAQSPAQSTPKLGKDPVSKVVAAMTPEEKAYFVTGTGMDIPGKDLNSGSVQGAPVVGQTHNLVPGAAGTTYAIPRLGIPAIVLADGPAGLRINPKRTGDNATYYCTAFPVATLLASTWDTELVNSVGKAMGNEVLEYGADILLAPGMNIQRNPLCGRNFEYYSEDPFVAGNMAAAMVNGIESQGVGTSVKHFAANNTETNRNALNTIVSERALREIYLEGFRIAVQQSQPLTIMSSYNLINNVYAAESFDLLTKVLRNDWDFKGYVMTDWFGGKDPAAIMKSGNDLIMPGMSMQANAILEALKSGKLDPKILDRNIARILNGILLSPHFKGYKASNKPDLAAHAAIARQAAAEGMVLLKNDHNTLPIPANVKKIAVFGITSYDMITGGTGSGDVNEAYTVSLTDGLKNQGYEPNGLLNWAYENYIAEQKTKLPEGFPFLPKARVPEMTVDAKLAAQAAEVSDVALITIGRNSGEFVDRKVDGDFNLTAAETVLIKNVTEAYHAAGKKAIVVLNICGVIETASWKEQPDAILLAWEPGQESGNSIADVLSGKVNPSGKLAVTFPLKYEDVPSAKNFPGFVTEKGQPASESGLDSFMKSKASKIVYEEGIYVGYRYYNTFKVPVSYEFGFGKSYSTFEYSNLNLSSKNFNGSMIATVEVKNTGKLPGREVVQLYLSTPAKSMDKPAQELKAFAKTRLLQPGESQTLSFEISARSLASFDTGSSTWIAEAGAYTVKAAASSADIRQSATFSLAKPLKVKKESKALSPAEVINELKH